MKVKHRNISNNRNNVILHPAKNNLKIRKIESLLVSNTYSGAITLDVFIRSIDAYKSARRPTEIIDSTPLYNASFYIVKNLQIPQNVSVDIFGEFLKGFSYDAKYELVILLGNSSYTISTILTYE
tara:strand:+ start:2012 stop:2386 length:375 start_codon:yes stop_codon:yes gene_type:complete